MLRAHAQIIGADGSTRHVVDARAEIVIPGWSLHHKRARKVALPKVWIGTSDTVSSEDGLVGPGESVKIIVDTSSDSGLQKFFGFVQGSVVLERRS